jgi:hypothetical protein
MPCLPELVKRPLDEAECDWCGCPLVVGDRCYVDLDEGAIYCSPHCAHSDEAERTSNRDLVYAGWRPGDDD